MLNLHSLQEYRTKLKECERDLQDLIEAPQPLKVQPLSTPEQEQHDQGVCETCVNDTSTFMCMSLLQGSGVS